MFRETCLGARLLHKVSSVLQAVEAWVLLPLAALLGPRCGSNRTIWFRGVAHEQGTLRSPDKGAPGHLERLPDLLLRLVMVDAYGQWMMRGSVIGPRNFSGQYVLGSLQPLVTDQSGRPERRMANWARDSAGTYASALLAGSVVPASLTRSTPTKGLSEIPSLGLWGLGIGNCAGTCGKRPSTRDGRHLSG
jgi:hypothetical protein